MAKQRLSYDVIIRARDLKRGPTTETRAFPSGGEPGLACYSTAVSLVCGVLHWVHVSVAPDGRVHVVGGNRRSGPRYALAPVHDSWTELDVRNAAVSYTIQDRFEIEVVIREKGPRPTPESAPPKSAMSAEEVAALIGQTRREAPKTSALRTLFDRFGIGSPRPRPRSVVRTIDRRTIARMRGS